ncbi:glutathione S-transferase C-terminal domain-containing protein [Mycoplana sp. MJR14]|uniref:glutathione S-transferase C-terminal domain-containing protein n=1 Tax=Mycoplana sp. MJR14 TaxID=3032583 RepID=UPI0023DA9831|nr:glutathione S-transferase C-terminal domain-containing protein [Mycoplana sp. MJR14]MDF1633633.1 glutathione S-transferase C-terminal domain-containing protein [Mycoplana sp. MJR14]
MKLYYSPLACSLADHIVLLEAGVPFEPERVDLRTKRTASGGDLRDITPKGYVPVLVLDSGDVLTENIAILDWLASQYPALGGQGPLGRTRLLEALTYLSTELHHAFKARLNAGGQTEKERAEAVIAGHLDFLSEGLEADYLFGDTPTVADFYLFVMLLWAEKFDIGLPTALAGLRARIKARPAVRTAMINEGLI